MRLPEIVLDDRRFQDLVNEARVRIAQSCPEWTEHNVSDPGITLIELFAWLTDVLVYRVNRIPDKLHVALLELLGITLAPPTAATADIRFRLSTSADEEVAIPAETEVGTLRTLGEESTVFQTDEAFVIPPARPVAYVIERGGAAKELAVAKGEAKPKGADQAPFGMPPAVNDAMYIGFDTSLARIVLQVDVECSQARGAGVDPEDPPLRWEVSAGEGENWEEAEVLVDSTGGFNYGSGVVELQLPKRHGPDTVAGRRAFWVRCRVADLTRAGAEGAAFQNPPEIYAITAAPVGALIAASHASRVAGEVLGTSDGTPSQTFRLRHVPILPLLADETLEVLDPDTGVWEPWERRESFVESGADDRHYLLDEASGTVEFGPSIRMLDGSWRQYGATPPNGAGLRLARYRRGGGRSGNVTAGTLTMLKEAIPRVASVTNPRAAFGGVDPESLDSGRKRAGMELRTRYRAVTAEDFEFLSEEASARVARARCVPPPNGGPVRVHVLPRVEPADRQLALEELTPQEDLLQLVAKYLDERRLLGTRIEVLPVHVRGVSVVVNLQAAPSADLGRVEEDVAYALYSYLNPLVGGLAGGLGEGWEFGRALNQGELFHIVQSIDGVEFVKALRLYETDLATGKQDPKQSGAHIVLEPDELIASAEHNVKAEYPELM